MIWISKQEEKFMRELQEKHERIMLGLETPDEIITSTPCNKKWAWIEVDGERIMAFVDNVTMKAYKADGYEKTDIEIPNYKFERWCRPMDL